MNLRLLINTVVYLKPRQVLWQIIKRVKQCPYQLYEAPERIGCYSTEWSVKPKSLHNNDFKFLNIQEIFKSWNDTRHGMLWAYNLNYMDWLNQRDMNEDTCCYWIDKYFNDFSENKIGKDPYPTALRIINLIKAFSRWPNLVTKSRLDWLYSQAVHLSHNFEYHLLGNHLLEDAFSLYIVANWFNDDRLLKKSSKLLFEQLDEQILNDGAHYEQSPMYHCILLDRLLDCINFDTTNSAFLREKASMMLGHLENICFDNGAIPLLNDSANGIAPLPSEIFDYARRLNLHWNAIDMSESGYRKLKNEYFEAIVDVGNITATYQPGHTHADVFNYVLNINERPFVVDTGISTYEKNSRRLFERSTSAHNTVSINSLDSCEVWGGFRVGNRYNVTVIDDEKNLIKASHDGFRKLGIHTRCFELTDNELIVTDSLSNCLQSGVSNIILAPQIEIINISERIIKTNNSTIIVDGAEKIIITHTLISTEYNKYLNSNMIQIYFHGKMRYRISI